MSPTLVLLNIIGGVCLLLWGLRGVRNGVTRAFGADLRKIISSGTSNRILSLMSGIGVTALVQSSTATALIIAAFCGKGMMTITAGLAVMLGADVGTTLVAQVLTFDLSWLIPLMLIVGYIIFNKYPKSARIGHIGKMVLHLGLMLIALGLIRDAAEPLKESTLLPMVLQALDNDSIMPILMIAILTWIAHSSLAIILLLMTFVSSGVIPVEAGLLMVLGANLGGTIAPIVATLRDNVIAARVPVGNLIIRAVGVVIAFLFLPLLTEWMADFDPDPARMVVNFHTAFNIGLAILFLPLTGVIAKICEALMPYKEDLSDAARPKYLDENSLDTPVIALSEAARETLRMADLLEDMMEKTIITLRDNNLDLVHSIREEDDTIDRLYKSIKHYMAKITQESLGEEETHRYMQILNFSMNLEHAGDVLDKGLMALAEKKIRGQKSFSEEGMKEIENIHRLVLTSIRLAQNVFMSEDVHLARQMIEDKEHLRIAEHAAAASHFRRLHNAVPETIATSSLHMDIIRDYRRINTHIVAIAYTILEETGQLRSSRLKKRKN